MRDTYHDIFAIIIIFVIGVGVGRYLVPSSLSATYESLTAEEIQDGLDVYHACMDSTKRAGCRVSLDNFEMYHGLKREQRRRAMERARLAAEAALETEQ